MKNLTNRMNVRIDRLHCKSIVFIVLTFLFFNCSGQGKVIEEDTRSSNIQVNDSTKDHISELTPECNRASYNRNDIKKLPSYICIPDGYMLDDEIRFSDLDGDGKSDFMAFRYRLNKQYNDWKDGDTIYWKFHLMDENTGRHKEHLTLNNIVPPFLSDTGLEYIVSDSLALKIYENYPLTLYRELSFQVSQDTLKISYKYDASSGKSFVFVYSGKNKNWYLKNIEFFYGEVPLFWSEPDRGGNEMYEELHDKLLPIYVLEAKEKVPIDEFSLIEAFKYKDEENQELEECFGTQLRELEKQYKSVWDFKFESCYRELEWPEGWKY